MERARVAVLTAALVAAVACGGRHHGSGVLPLTVLSSTPGAGADGVATDATIEVDFSDVLDDSLVSPSSIAVSIGGAAVPGDVTIVAGGKGLRFYPTAPFQHLATVDVSVPAGLAAKNGATLAAAFAAQFRTVAKGIYLGQTRVEGLVGTSAGLAAFLVKDDGSFVQLNGGAYSIANPAVATVATNGGNLLTVHLVAEGLTRLNATGPGSITATLPIAAATTTGDGTAFMVSSSLLNGASHHEWDVSCDGTLVDGGADEVNGASNLTVDPDVTAAAFACPATVAGVAFQAPWSVLNDLELETSLPFVNTGASSCHLLPTGQSAMSQDIQMPNAATALTLTWNERIRLQDNDALTTKSLVVSVENLTDGTAPVTVMTSTATAAQFDNAAFATQTVDLLPLNVLGKKIRLTFTARGGGYDRTFYQTGDGVHLDDVSIQDQAANEYVLNGGCEGLTNWTARLAAVPRTVVLGPETLAGLDVTRSVYAGDDGYWARVIDTFTNNSGADIMVPIQYDTNLGSDGNGTLEQRDAGAAAVSYDTATGDPNFAQVIFSAGTNNMAPFNATWDWRYDISVPAGQTVSLAQFWAMGDASVPAYSPMVEALVDQITTSVRGQGINSPFMVGVTAQQYATLSNIQ